MDAQPIRHAGFTIPNFRCWVTPVSLNWKLAMLARHDSFGRLRRARELLGEVREYPLSIKDVAREIGISPFHFIGQFEALFGLTPHQFRI